MENLNDLIWTDEGNDDGIQPQGLDIPIVCMTDYCMGALCSIANLALSCTGGATQSMSCK